MKHISKENELLLIYSMGKKLKITAMFDNDDECNKHLAQSNDSVIACFGGFVLCADKSDKGI
jgi:microcompartment protein CcmK/EutM